MKPPTVPQISVSKNPRPKVQQRKKKNSKVAAKRRVEEVKNDDNITITEYSPKPKSLRGLSNSPKHISSMMNNVSSGGKISRHKHLRQNDNPRNPVWVYGHCYDPQGSSELQNICLHFRDDETGQSKMLKYKDIIRLKQEYERDLKLAERYLIDHTHHQKQFIQIPIFDYEACNVSKDFMSARKQNIEEEHSVKSKRVKVQPWKYRWAKKHAK